MGKNICIIGLGLIGGSIGMAVKKKGIARVFGLTRDKEKAALAHRLKAADYATTTVKGVIEDADIIFVCYPIHLIVPQIKKIVRFVRPGTIITDVGSSKEFIVKEAEKLMPRGVYFVGGHPMAGKETTGLEEADAELFKGKTYVLTKTPKTNAKALNDLKIIISKLGAKVKVMGPADHDEAVALISHMPIAVAASLVEALADSGRLCDEAMELAASGFQDATRIASGDPQMGTDMFITNKAGILTSLSKFKKALVGIERLIKQGSAEQIRYRLDQIKDFRDSIYK
jgi:prephenate dehydrogenase